MTILDQNADPTDKYLGCFFSVSVGENSGSEIEG